MIVAIPLTTLFLSVFAEEGTDYDEAFHRSFLLQDKNILVDALVGEKDIFKNWNELPESTHHRLLASMNTLIRWLYTAKDLDEIQAFLLFVVNFCRELLLRYGDQTDLLVEGDLLFQEVDSTPDNPGGGVDLGAIDYWLTSIKPIWIDQNKRQFAPTNSVTLTPICFSKGQRVSSENIAIVDIEKMCPDGLFRVPPLLSPDYRRYGEFEIEERLKKALSIAEELQGLKNQGIFLLDNVKGKKRFDRVLSCDDEFALIAIADPQFRKILPKIPLKNLEFNLTAFKKRLRKELKI